MLRSMHKHDKHDKVQGAEKVDMGANFQLKKNAGIILSAEGMFIAITTWANQQVQHVLILKY